MVEEEEEEEEKDKGILEFDSEYIVAMLHTQVFNNLLTILSS